MASLPFFLRLEDVSHAAVLRIASLPLLDELLVDNDYKSALRFANSTLATLAKKHGYLIDFEQHIAEEKLVAMQRFFTFEEDGLEATCHMCAPCMGF